MIPMDSQLACPSTWTRHLMVLASTGAAHLPPLSEAEAQRVQRHRDRLLAALQAHDRHALLAAKQQVLQDAFGAPEDAGPGPARVTPSAALRCALRDLSWRMAGLLVQRGMER